MISTTLLLPQNLIAVGAIIIGERNHYYKYFLVIICWLEACYLEKFLSCEEQQFLRFMSSGQQIQQFSELVRFLFHFPMFIPVGLDAL
jgi:hypothetical protein